MLKQDLLNYIENRLPGRDVIGYESQLKDNFIYYVEDLTKSEWTIKDIEDIDNVLLYANEIIYYSEAFAFLKDNQIYDFTEAMDAGYCSVEEIANYFYFQMQDDEINKYKNELIKRMEK